MAGRRPNPGAAFERHVRVPFWGRRVRIAALAVGALAVTAPGAVDAAVWKRIRPDGTEEFTNIRPTGGGWKPVKGTDVKIRRGPTTSPVESKAPSPVEPSAPAASPSESAPAPSTTEPAPVGEPAAPSEPVALPTVSPPTRPPPAPTTRRSGNISPAGSVIWGRDNEDGTVEFTNLRPTGARWKVLYRTGPGKAAALRGPSDLVPPRDVSSSRFSRYDRHIRDQQTFYGVPVAFVRAVIKVESDYDPRVVSSAGCVGLMQLAPATARSMGVTDIWDPRQNIMGGSRYLATLARRYCRTPRANGFMCAPEELVKVIAGYHAGPGAVEKYGGMPPYETTRAYVASVLARYEEFRHKERQSAAMNLASAQSR
jgi:hypothetical protein